MTGHIVKRFGEELQRLQSIIMEMGGMAESQIEAAIQCVQRRDAEQAMRVREDDRKIDALESELYSEAVRILALRQPVASDLREILAALRISADLERIGDYAKNIAKRSVTLSSGPVVRPIKTVPRMGRLVQELVKDVLDALGERDLDKALAVWRRDEEVDDLHTSLFRETLTYMMEDPRNITACTHLLFIAKNLERIGDHATNIAETVHFLIAGEPLDARRPKGDSASFTTVTPDDTGQKAGDSHG